MKATDPANALPRDFYGRPTARVARDLLGCLLVTLHGGLERVGLIVETEAYDGFEDRASHASRRRTARNDVMFGPPGHAYVYLVYGMHHCLNFVTMEEGYPAAVLVRALEPVSGIELATSGPGRLCRAMGIDLRFNRADVTSPPMYVVRGRRPRGVDVTPRIGVDYAGDWSAAPLRFLVRGNRFVSRAPGRR
jgi:DNA-3-methyladenine glycosylase